VELFDPRARLDVGDVAALARAASMPLPARVIPEGIDGQYWRYRLCFDEPGNDMALWVEPEVRWSAGGLAHAAAAHRTASVEPAIPLVPQHTFGPEVMGRHAAIRPLTPSKFTDPDFVGQALAQLFERLETLATPWHGTRAEDRRFVPTRRGWAEEWYTHAAGLHARACQIGTDLGALSSRALAEIEAAETALDQVSDWHLVHGSLDASCLRTTPAGPVVVGWERAIAGDRLVDAATFLSLPNDILRCLLHHLDPETIASWTSGPAMARIRAYHLTWCLRRLADIAEHSLMSRSTRPLAQLAPVAAHLEAALEPGFVNQRLALSIPPAWPREAAALRVALGNAHTHRSHSAHAIDAFAHGFCDGLLVARAPQRHRPSLPATNHQLLTQPDATTIPRLDVWATQLANDALAAAHGRASAPITLAWVGLAGLELQRGSTSTVSYRSLEARIRGGIRYAAAAGDGAKLGNRRRILRSLFGLASVRGLRALQLSLDEKLAANVEAEFSVQLMDHVLDEDISATWTTDWPPDSIWQAAQADQPLLTLSLLTLLGHVALPNNPTWVYELVTEPA
jgi:hypothetical protein